AEIEMRLGMAGIERRRPRIARRRLVEAPERSEREAGVEIGGRLAFLEGDRLLDQLDRRLVAALLMGDDAEAMPGGGLPRIEAKDLPAGGLGLGEPARE